VTAGFVFSSFSIGMEGFFIHLSEYRFCGILVMKFIVKAIGVFSSKFSYPEIFSFKSFLYVFFFFYKIGNGLDNLEVKIFTPMFEVAVENFAPFGVSHYSIFMLAKSGSDDSPRFSNVL
jgi:hypothetical protein